MSEGTPGHSKEKAPSLEVMGTFSLPDQTEELDFKKLLEQPLFNRNYYLYPDQKFKELVLDPSIPFNGVRGREYVEARILEDVGDAVVMSELETEPVSLNEWKYLFSQLSEKRFAGETAFSEETTFYVKMEDGDYAFRLLVDRRDGPYSYSISVEKLDPRTHALLKKEGRHALLEGTKVISAKKKQTSE